MGSSQVSVDDGSLFLQLSEEVAEGRRSLKGETGLCGNAKRS